MAKQSEILTFQEALDKSGTNTRNLLLGNGFSIACNPSIFHYSSLYEKAMEKIKQAMPEVNQLFKKIGIKDFEAIIHLLENAHIVLPFYFPNETIMLTKIYEHASTLKEILIDTIAHSHPEYPSNIPEEKFVACRRFLSHFIGSQLDGKLYTLNYDLLLYWTLLHTETEAKNSTSLSYGDGFGKDNSDDSDLIWINENHSSKQNIFYLHGALHFFNTKTELKKYTWNNTGKRLLDQISGAMKKDKFPLFVAEGKAENKLEKIRSHPYLYHCYKSFICATKQSNKKEAPKKSLFIFGHSLAENDDHIIEKIAKGSFSNLFVSIYQGENANREDNNKIIDKTHQLCLSRDSKCPLDVNFYDAETAQVWNMS